MQRTLTFLALMTLLLLAGCKTTNGNNKPAWGEAYADVPVPVNYEAHDNPPFKRQDSDAGKRIYGKYSYRSTGEGLDDAGKVQEWFKAELPNHGWELMVEELDKEKGTMAVRFKKADDQLLVSLAPDKRMQGKRFSVLVIELNPKFS
ncbi:MAG: hypothetical protein KF696_09160 [Planctomycetes bacterium]|nr:hypothetical protein [Planctomycetota bacterium]MCW8136755.1 hypothetical protein [Planctomycetota bacterium]